MFDPLRNHIAAVRQVPDAGAALRQRLGDVLGDPEHPQIPAVEEALATAIDAIPVILENMSAAAQQAGIAHLIAPLFQQVSHYFLSGDDLIPDHAGTLGLLDDAYLVHAFLAQVNGAYQASTGRPLLAFDPSPALQVLGGIIGPQVAGHLDQAVTAGVGQAVQQSRFEQLTQWNGTLSPTGGPGAWGGSWEDEMARVGAECGISFN